MNRDELVERVAEEIGRNSPCEMSLDYAKSLARAVLAIIEPAVREECAKVCDARYMGDNNREDQEARRCAAPSAQEPSRHDERFATSPISA